MRGARLVQWCELFGVSEGTTRVALSRMVDRGELDSQEGFYELAGRARTRRRAQDWSIDPKFRAWRGEWSTAVVTGASRAPDERSALREAMRHLRYGELREGVWSRPANLPRAAAADEWWAVADEQCRWWSGRPADDPAAVARELFAVDDWAATAATHSRRLAQETRGLAGAGDGALATAFVAGADALAHVRADPMLPPELVPADAGVRLRAAYADWERAFAGSLQAWFREHR
jgi:phenylacetic acid degradation operon negative regulatory protein